MRIHDLNAVPGDNKPVKRIGRGPASGQGKTAGKGHKGQKARAGRGMRPGFEGGQMPLQRRVPKRGFNNIFAAPDMAIVNLGALNELFEDGAVVDAAAMVDCGLVKSALNGIKILAGGELTKKLTVKADAFSASAKAKIESLGGAAEIAELE